MAQNLEALTQKLLSEGVEKGQAEATRIIAEAKSQAEQIIADAKAQADDITAQAKKDAAALDTNTKSELRMAADQAISALKTEITDVVNAEAVSSAVGKAVGEKDFLQKFIVKLAENWGTGESLVIETDDAAALKGVFAKQAKKLLDKGVKIVQVNGRKASFSIAPADGSYKVNFGEEEFEEYFKSFLRPQLIDMLFA